MSDCPTVRFDPEARRNYLERPDGTREYHEIPAGHVFDANGALHAPQLVAARDLMRDDHLFRRGDRVPADAVADVWEHLLANGTLAHAGGAGGGAIPMRPRPAPAGLSRRLSVVIAVHNAWRYTEECLRTLRADAPGAEVIVVDNGSTDETAGRLAGMPLRTIRWDENRGVAPAWNAGLRECSGGILCVLNNDTAVRPGGIRRLVLAAREQGIAALQGGRLDRDFNFSGYTTDPWQSDYPDGCCLLFRRDVWQDVGEFDEGFAPAYCEDSDWGLRAASRGWWWRFEPESVTHYGQRTARDVGGLGPVQARNLARLRSHWAGQGLGERIRVHRRGALGDVLMLTPALSALRRQKPLARIHLSCAASIAALLQGSDLADLVGDRRVGGYTQQVDLDGTYERDGKWLHPAAVYARHLGVALPAEPYRVPETPDLDAWAAELLPDGPVYVACGLRSAFRPKSNWGEGRWRALAAAVPEVVFVLLDSQGQPCVDARPEDRPPRARLYSAPNTLDLTGRTPDLRSVAALLRRCRACVSVDTGILHLANAAGLPVVGLFGGTPSAARAPLAGAFRGLDGKAPCFPCRNPERCDHAGPHCLAAVRPVAVAAALREMLT